MLSFKTAIVAGALLVPFSVSFADDEVTQTLHNNTYQQSGQAFCNQPGACAISFPPTEHITTAVTGVSCYTEVDSGGQIIRAYLGDTNNTPAQFHVQPLYTGSSDGRDIYEISALTNLYFSKGKQPLVEIFVVGGFAHAFYCTISGYHS